jgi:hypothetical protein
VTEEFARDAYHGLEELKDEVERSVQNLTAQIQELKEETGRRKHEDPPATAASAGVALGATSIFAAGSAALAATVAGATSLSTGVLLEGTACSYSTEL